MATMQELEQALINADKAGDVAAAQQLADAIIAARQDPANLIPDAQIPFTLRKPEPTLGQQAIGVGEAALTGLTGATGGTLGMIGGTLKGLAEQILSGQFGTQEATKLVEQEAAKGAGALTYAPRTETGREMAADLGRAAASTLGALPPVLPIAPMAGPAISQAGRAPVAAIRRATMPTAAAGSMGAAATPQAAQRATVARQMPVPFTGQSGLTKGQATRDYAQLQFEKETAKQSDIGEPLRERVQNQTATMIQNFDALIDQAQPFNVDKADIGTAVTQAVVNKAEIKRKQISAAYKAARDAGEMLAPVDMDTLPGTFADLDRYAGVAPIIDTVRKEAKRLGAIDIDDTGSISAGSITVDDAELLRQFVNKANDWTDPRSSLFAKQIIHAIDDATENSGGKLYKEARGMRRRFADEFENTGLTSKLLGTKGKTSERQIAVEQVFDKVVRLSSVEEMNKLRSTLLTAGPEGKQAWADLKAKGLDWIKDQSLSASQMDAAGNRLLPPDKLNKAVKHLDETGKLESLYGKAQAQTLRDLAELSTVIYTAPPGAINTSNTASAIMNALDIGATYTMSGLPIPAKAVLTEAGKYLKNRKTRARVQEALKWQKDN